MESKTKVLRKVNLMRALPAVFVLATLVGAIASFSSCASEDLDLADYNGGDTVTVIKNLYWTSERTGVSIPTVEDDQAKSDVTFAQTSSLYNEQEKLRVNFKPTAYLNVRLTKPRIDVLSKDELPVTLVREYVESRTPYKNQTTYGFDVVKIFEYSDGERAIVSYGWRYTGVPVGNDTLAVPHMEIDDVKYVRQNLSSYGTKTETEDPYKSVLQFEATTSMRGTSGDVLTSKVNMKPWYLKVISSEATKVLKVEYTGKYTNCPVDGYELVQKVVTNKGEFSETYRVPLSIDVKAPEPREQPSADSLFNATSTGKFAENKFSETKTENGFTVRTMTGTYRSTNTGKKARTSVESTVNFTYQFPVKFENEYGSYDISPLSLKFEEIEFNVKKVSEDKDTKVFRSVNTVVGTLGTCELDVIDEVVTLLIPQEKAPDVVKRDSTYVLKGEDDDYIVEKTITWSDGSKTTTTYEYQGRHSATAEAFGNKQTTSLNWNEGALKKGSQSKATEEKKFSPTTKFSVVYTTTNWSSDATNGKESGTFGFKETSPVVTFIDGAITKTFSERKYTLSGQGADVSTNYTMMTVNGVSYKAYAYDYITKATWNGKSQPNLVSNGYLLMNADEVGDPVYTPSQSWSGNTVTVKVVKRTPHTQAQDEVETFTKNFTISLNGLTDGKVYAENTNFSTTESVNETNTSVTDGYWKVTTYKRAYAYKVSNGKVTRDDIKANVTDAIIDFNDGKYQHTFNVRLNVTKDTKLGNTSTEGNYEVTPYVLTVSGSTNDGKSLSDKCTTKIYVEQKPEEPETPHMGKPKAFTVTATYDPTAKVTRRAFVFNWEDGVTYAVCDYETMLPESKDFMFKLDSYDGYNSVGYDKDNSSNHWQPARGSDDKDAIRWYKSSGSLMSAIDKALSCKVIGWKNIVNGDYALIIPGYTYEINGYNITVKAPNGKTVTFNSHYKQ